MIEPRSEDSFDKDENQFAVREIINNYQCEQCFEKDKTLKECVAIARETLASSKAVILLNDLIKQQQYVIRNN